VIGEEIKDASRTLPKAMMSAVGVNACLGFIMIITICFTLGDVNSVLETPTGFPFIQIFYNTTQSYAATNTMTAILVITLTASTITEVATACARQRASILVVFRLCMSPHRLNRSTLTLTS
jgi:amino acid transporter